MTERRELPHDPKALRRELQRRILSLLPALGIVDPPRAGLVQPLNPRRHDRNPGSFVIWTEGEGVGAWRDYALGEDAKGDVFDLIRYLLGLRAWIDAYWWALEFVGWGRGEVRSAEQAALDRQRQEADRKAAEARADADAERKGKGALGLWLKCEPISPLDQAWRYLEEARGLPLRDMAAAPGALRFHGQLEHIDRETGEITTWPALVSAMSRWNDGKVYAAHRTYLARDGLGKAPVASAKKMMGVARGCAVRISKGDGGKTPEAAARAGKAAPLVITEGIEDAITAAIARPDFRVWAAGSLSLLGTLGWPDCASAVVLVADNDWDKPQAVEAFNKVFAHWRDMAAGRALKVVRAEVGKDLNDWARGVA